MIKKVTRADVAKRAGVSQTIVSYALNDNRYVEKSKKEAVLKAAKELGYTPSPLSRALKGKGSGHYLFIADDLMSEHFAIITGEMENLAKDRGMCISLCSDRNDTSLFSWHFDGLIIASALMSEERINEYIKLGFPTVILAMKDYKTLEGSYGLVNSGLEKGSFDAVSLLLEKGREDILFIPSLNMDSFENDFRFIGYKKAMDEHGKKVHVLKSAKSEKELHTLIEQEAFDAAFARTDSTAAVAMQAIKEMGKKIPEDVAVIGVNNTSLSRFLYPTLSTINIDRKAIAESILSLFERLKTESNPSITLTTNLLIRGSI